ncbi:MAG: type II toxin-antitoxin system HicA family toxin [Bacillota bacterium]|nr:type II toxin-antitoxin system HicA family toxin [Bacillota bacterium]
MRDIELLRLLQKEGWEVQSIKGSHHKLVKDGKKITLSVHKKELTKGMLNAILKQAGLK